MVREIKYTVKATGVEPATIQFGGVQGEHRATRLIFNLASELSLSLQAQKNDNNELKYRIDAYDGMGGVHRTDAEPLLFGESISYLLEEKATRYGGTVKAVLVITLIENDSTEMELCSFPVALRLTNKPDGTDVCGENHESMSTLAEIARDNAEVAAWAKERAVLAQVKTELARALLENGTEWVFDGGDADEANAVDIVVVKDKDFKIQSGLELVSSTTANGTEFEFEWNFEKWNSGKAECWGTVKIPVLPDANWGTAFFSTYINTIAFPQNLFSAPPVLMVDVSESTGNYFVTKRETDKNYTGTMYIVSPTKLTSESLAQISITAKGKWY